MSPLIEAAWIAGASGFLGVVVGVTGTVIVAVRGFRSTHDATTATIMAGTANVQAQIEAGQEAQRQDRLDRAYSELGMYLSRYADWARSVQPFWGAPEPPPPLPAEDRWKVETVVTLYGSPDVRRLLEQWTEHARKIDNADDIIRRFKESTSPNAELDAEARREQLALLDYKAAMSTADDAMRGQMNRELAGDRPRPPAPSQLDRPLHAEAIDEGQNKHALAPPEA